MKSRNVLVCASTLYILSTVNVFACEEVRMGFDIGSGATKTLIANVDYCKNKILTVLYSDNRPVAYNEDLAKSADNKLSPEIVNKGESVLKEYLETSKKFKPKKIYGVATSVFRKASNGQEVINELAKRTKVKLDVISHQDEALLGYYSARAVLDEKALPKDKNLLAWDIGGGSMQMTVIDQFGKPTVYLGDLASVTFKNMLVEAIQLKDVEKVTSPNPLQRNYAQAVALARSYAKIHVPKEIKEALKNAVVVGVGGVHGHSINAQVAPKDGKYDLVLLSKAAKEQVKKKDKDLKGEYRATDVSNLLLVQGFMEGLGISEVQIVESSLLQGSLFK